jgi:hypothetical protein
LKDHPLGIAKYYVNYLEASGQNQYGNQSGVNRARGIDYSLYGQYLVTDSI